MSTAPAASVLVVDDEEGVRSFLAEALELSGYDVAEAEDGQAALEALSRRSFHVLITDLTMPRVDGMTLLRRVRADQPELEIIVLTAHGTIETAVTGLLDGRGELEGSVAVIVPPALESSLRRACARFDSDVLVLDGSAAKGLEFDHVIVVEPADIAEDGALGLRRLYIALTRCTQTLTVVHSKPLPTALALDVDEDQVRADVRKARLKNLRRSLGRRAATSVVHPRSYLRWSTEEEEDLRRRVDTGLSLEEVADLHQRTPRSVLRRLKKLGVDAPPSNQSS